MPYHFQLNAVWLAALCYANPLPVPLFIMGIFFFTPNVQDHSWGIKQGLGVILKWISKW